MAAGFNKATLFFSDGKYGWTEQYWDPVQEELTATGVRAVRLASNRQLMLAGGAGICLPANCGIPRLVYIRISQLGMRRNTIFMNPAGQVLASAPNSPIPIGKRIVNVGNASTTSTAAPDNPYSAVGLVGTIVGGGKSKRSISGLPDAYICDQGLNPNDDVNKWITQFGAYLTAEPWGALSVLGHEDQRQIPQPAGGNPALLGATAIAPQTAMPPGISQNAQGQPVVTLVAPMTLPGNCCTQNRLTITCYVPQAGTPTLNGTYSVSPIGSGPTITQFVIRKVFRPLSPFCAGFVVPYNPQVLAFTDIALTGPTKRDRGVIPFGRPRGRARRRA